MAIFFASGNFRKKIYKTKSALPNNFSLGRRGFSEVFQPLGILDVLGLVTYPLSYGSWLIFGGRVLVR